MKQDETGFVYVDVDDEYIYQLFPFIKKKRYELPPYFNRPLGHGAHISVIYEREAQKYCIPLIEEAGAMISFKIVGCKEVIPSYSETIESAFVIEIQAPFLDRIRQKYGLPAPQHPYHITIGVKLKKRLNAA